MEDFWIDGFGISNYRSFGPEPQLVGPCGKINVIVGQNNCGKSNVLRFLSEHLKGLLAALTGNSDYTDFQRLDRPVSSESEQRQLWLGLRLDDATIKRHATLRHDGKATTVLNPATVKRLLSSPAFGGNEGIAWFCYALGTGRKIDFEDGFLAEVERNCTLSDQEWGRLYKDAFHNPPHGPKNKSLAEVLRVIGPANTDPLAVSLIPAIREIERSPDGKYLPSGIGLIERLAELERPSSWQDGHLKDKFKQIERFLQTVADNQEATIEISADQKSIFVNTEGKRLPLEALGTGIHEVIIIAAHATLMSRQVICIEEPEIHLHPTLQRKLIRFLQTDTDNQYFIATHSAHLLDFPEASVFHVRCENGYSAVEPVGSPGGRSSVCFDLGYRPSDLVQTNCVIWVEGPSDRVYLNHWIKGVDSELIEGTHYSIMFYGGRLLSNLSADDPEVDEFISLRRLNRRMVVLMDSDRESSDGGINATKERICRELDRNDGFAWVTQGREIENYIPVEITTAAIEHVHQDATVTVDDPDFGRRLGFVNKDKEPRTADKIKVARFVVKQEPNLDVLNLEEMVRRTVDFIRDSNDICSTP